MALLQRSELDVRARASRARRMPITTFVQKYNQHLDDAARSNAPIILQQRAGRESWVLEREDRVLDNQQATNFATSVLGALARDKSNSESFNNAILEAFPWVAFLPTTDRAEFASDAATTLAACVSLGELAPFSNLVMQWENTARIWADPQLAQALTTHIEHPLNVPVEL